MMLRVNVSVGEEQTVAIFNSGRNRLPGVIVRRVEGNQVFIAQRGNSRRNASRNVLVVGIRQIRGAHGAENAPRGISLIALHFVIHNTLDLIVLQSPSLLLEIGEAQQREEGCIAIYIHQIREITRNGRTHGIGGVVVKRPRIHIATSKRGTRNARLQRALSHLHKGVVDGVFLRAAERGMLQNVADSRVVLTGRAERDARCSCCDSPLPEHIIRVGSVYVEVVCSRLLVDELVGCHVQLRDGKNTHALETVNQITPPVLHFVSVFSSLCDPIVPTLH